MATILDHRGHPVKSGDLQAAQTAKLGHLHKEFADHPARGLTPAKLASILTDAERGDLTAQCDLFDDMEERDGHIYAELSKRRRALLGLDWEVVAPRGATATEETAAEWVGDVLRDLSNFEDTLLDMADAIGKGFSCLEITWGRDGNEWVPSDITHRPPRWFTVAKENHDRLLLRRKGQETEALRPFSWITHIHKAKSGYLGRAGLHRVLAWPYLFKNYSVRDLAEFLEIYGLPLRLGTYPPGSSDKEKATLLRAVVNLGHNAAGIIPEGMMVDFKEAAADRSDPFQAMIDWCERTQSKAILGGTLTSQADGKTSTNALGTVHNEVRHDLLVADALQLASTLTRDLVWPLATLNLPGLDPGRGPRFRFDTREPEDLKLYADAIPKLVEVGMEIPLDYAHDKLRIPRPQEDEEVLRPALPFGQAALRRAGFHPPDAVGRMNPALRGACPHCAALRAGDPDPDTADHYADQLDEAAASAMDGLLAPVRRLVATARSMDELRDGLLALYPEMGVSDLAATLQQAFTAADLAGRFEVGEGR